MHIISIVQHHITSIIQHGISATVSAKHKLRHVTEIPILKQHKSPHINPKHYNFITKPVIYDLDINITQDRLHQLPGQDRRRKCLRVGLCLLIPQRKMFTKLDFL